MDETSVLIISVLVVVHVLGLILLLINSCYLVCTRGYGSTRISQSKFRKRNRDLDKPETKRCCKLRSAKACNILVLYHILLIIIEVGFAIVCYIEPSLNHEFNDFEDMRFALLIAAVCNFGFIIIFILPYSYSVGALRAHAQICHLNACSSFEVLNFILFWASLLLLIGCSAADCSEPSLLDLMGSGLAAVPLILSYIILLIGAKMYKKRLNKVQNPISSQEAVTTIGRKIQEPPYLKWTISCGHQEGSGDSSK